VGHFTGGEGSLSAEGGGSNLAGKEGYFFNSKEKAAVSKRSGLNGKLGLRKKGGWPSLEENGRKAGGEGCSKGKDLS